jgi:hypothetical protein
VESSQATSTFTFVVEDEETDVPSPAPTQFPSSSPSISSASSGAFDLTVTLGGGVLQALQLDAVLTAATNVESWYGSNNKAQTPEGLESSDQLTITVLENGNGYHVVMIYDQPVERGDTTAGKAKLSVSCNGGSCNFEHFNNVDQKDDDSLEIEWKGCCTGGFIVGPFSGSTTVCVDHEEVEGLNNGARYADRSNVFSVASKDDMEDDQICVSMSVSS